MSARYDIANSIVSGFQALRPGDYPLDSRLADLGIDSLDIASVVVQTEDECGLALAEEGIEWAAVRTIGDLVGVFENHASAVV